MTAFLIVAVLMAAIAAAAVALPLLRNRQSRIAGAVAGVLVAATAAGLYPLWSNWDWHQSVASQAAGPDVAAMVAKLEKRMRESPNDVAGWMMLGRSYLAMERLDDAILAYDHAHRLDANNADATLGLGESMSLRAGGNITPAAAKLFETALALAPGNPKALLYGGFAAAVRGDNQVATARWQALKNMHPPPQIEQMLDARMAELATRGASPASDESQGRGEMRAAESSPASAGNTGNAAGSGAPPAQATVNLSISPALKSRLTANAPLFVFAREPGGRGPPLAAKRLLVSAIGTQVKLSQADSMLPSLVLTNGQRVSITARVAFGGQPLPAAGDLYGELTYDVGRDGIRDLVIDRVAE